MTERKIDVGVLEESAEWLLHPRFFPSKIGGKPAWLDLKDLPAPITLTCKLCNDTLVFLAQIYAPYEESDLCFHRTIFIFVCKNGACCKLNSAENFVVLRCQLPRHNEYYSSEPYKDEEDEVFPMEKWPKLCNVCGIKGSSHCSKCKKTFYCSRNHQVLDWHKGHKELCVQYQNGGSVKWNNFIVTEAGKSLLFKEWELLVDEEDQEEVNEVNEYKEMEKLQKLIRENRAGTLSNVNENELEQYTKTLPEDKIFNKFSKRVARHPDQVLRYDRGGIPLWITGNTTTHDIPKCPYCDGERQFEFQVMPQLLNFINVGLDINSIDWGILAVYSCKESCDKGPAYKEEFMIKQDLST